MKNKKQTYKSNFIFLLVTISIVLISGSIYYFNKLKIDNYENYLLGISDTLKTIEINYNDNKEDILLDISTKLNKDLCCNKVKFNLKINNIKNVNVTSFKFCKKCVFHYHIFQCSSIFINRNNQILYNE